MSRQSTKERFGEAQRRSAATAVKGRHGRSSVRPEYSPTNKGRERFVKVYDVGPEVLDGSSRVSRG